jgi:hypothetical protein
VLHKSWQRAQNLYIIHIAIVFASLALAALLISAHLLASYHGQQLPDSDSNLLLRIFSLSFIYGWGSFFRYYAVFMLLAPFALYTLKTRYWVVIPILSFLVYILSSPYPIHAFSLGVNTYGPFTVWQFYFFQGLTLARFRVSIIRWFYGLGQKTVDKISVLVISAGIATLVVSILTTYNTYFYTLVDRLVSDGWLPVKLRSAYIHLLSHKSTLDLLFMGDRSGILRPVAAAIIMGAAYLVYQKYKEQLLRHSGNFVNTMGRETMWIYAAQALVIPIMMAIPVPRDSLLVDIAMTGLLIEIMWLLTQRKAIKIVIGTYISQPRYQLIKLKLSAWLQLPEVLSIFER